MKLAFVIFLVLLIIACWILARLLRAFLRYRLENSFPLPDDTPTVSVCIPARNEMHAMTECLERVLASDYPKMEVIVYDDSSIDETSVLIRSFAHLGVRFVPGNALPEGWLGKNHALNVLANEASGSKLVFLDVDTVVHSSTISELIGYMSEKQSAMITVIPRREDTRRWSVFLGTLRYFWALVLPGRHGSSATSFWAIDRHVLLEELGGFMPYRADVEPEVSMIRRLGSRYSNLLSNERLGVGYEKKWHSQCETARRLLYPMFGGKWWSTVIGVAGLMLLNLPTFVLCSALFTGWTLFHFGALLVFIVYLLLYGIYLKAAWGGYWWLGMLLWPYTIFQELILFVLSVVGYARHTITWKGRSVTRLS